MDSISSHLTLDFLRTVAEHPMAAYAAVFLISFLESLAFVGIIMPGALLIFGVGVVISTGSLALKPSLIAAMMGAVSGDGLSYWLGLHFTDRVERIWPFTRHPGMLTRGRQFFVRHGGKSVLFGRFVGPVRPVIPIIAGMFGMSPGKFVIVDGIAGIGWAFAYIMPGVVFGTSLAVSRVVSTRFTILVLIVIAVGWCTWWLIRRAAFFLERWDRKGDRLLFASFLLGLLASGICFTLIAHAIGTRSGWLPVDESVYHYFQSLRTPLGDRILVAVAELGDGFVNGFVAVGVLAALLVRRCYRSACFWLGHLVAGSTLILFLKHAFEQSRSIPFHDGLIAQGFPSEHVMMSVLLYGFVALLLARGRKLGARWLPFAVAVPAAVWLGLSQLYLGSQWLTGVLGGLFGGWCWLGLAGMGYLLTRPEPIPRKTLVVTLLSVVLTAGTWHIYASHAADLSRYAPHRKLRTMSKISWRTGGWQNLPIRRTDFQGEMRQLLNLQWVGSLARLKSRLEKSGWIEAGPTGLKSILLMLSPECHIDQLPLLPRSHEGRFDSLRLYLPAGDKRLVIRLWPTVFRIGDGDEPIWVGTIEYQIKLQLTAWVSVPVAIDTDTKAPPELIEALSGWAWWRRVTRSEQEGDKVERQDLAGDSEVILAAETPR